MITKKEWLEQPGRLSRRMAYHTERLLSLRREADAVASRWGESVCAQCSEAPYVRMLERIETLQEKLKWENELYDRLRAQVEEAIDGLPQEKMRLVLLYHYLEGKSFSGTSKLNDSKARKWPEFAPKTYSFRDSQVFFICKKRYRDRGKEVWYAEHAKVSKGRVGILP